MGNENIHLFKALDMCVFEQTLVTNAPIVIYRYLILIYKISLINKFKRLMYGSFE